MNSCAILLRNIMEHPDFSQRQLAEITGMSLGKVNQCLKEWEEKGFLERALNQGKEHKLTKKGFLRGTQGGCSPCFGGRLWLPLCALDL